MAWAIIRRATDEDNAALDDAAERFCLRHGIDAFDGHYDDALACALTPGYGASDSESSRAKYLSRLWRRIVRRTLDTPNADGIAWGYVGFESD